MEPISTIVLIVIFICLGAVFIGIANAVANEQAAERKRKAERERHLFSKWYMDDTQRQRDVRRAQYQAVLRKCPHCTASINKRSKHGECWHCGSDFRPSRHRPARTSTTQV